MCVQIRIQSKSTLAYRTLYRIPSYRFYSLQQTQPSNGRRPRLSATPNTINVFISDHGSFLGTIEDRIRVLQVCSVIIGPQINY